MEYGIERTGLTRERQATLIGYLGEMGVEMLKGIFRELSAKNCLWPGFGISG